jgi:uncharacterized phage infection (PIP) family protein YhgE
MSGDPLYVQTDGVRSYAETHDGVAAGLSQLTGSAAPQAAGVQSSHGTIAAAVGTALADVLGVRDGTLQTTATSGSTISELLHKAAHLYDQGDQKGAATLRAAAEALGGAQDTGGAGAGVDEAGAGGAGVMGQMVGQVAQQASQLGQVAQPLQGVTQGLQQIPQQVMQQVQQLSQSGQLGATSTPPSVDKPKDQRDEAAPGESLGSGRAPERSRAEDAKPAQTRPQSD